MAVTKKARTFDANEYVELGGIKTKALSNILVPISIAASALGIEQTTVRAHIRQGKLNEIIVDCGGLLVKGVSLGSIQETLAERETKVQNLADELEPLIWHRQGQTIEYGELMGMVGMSSNNPHHRDLIGRALGRLSEQSFSSYGFMISALVVLKSSQRPNEIFYELAHQIGAKKRSMSNERFWSEDMARIAEWIGPRSKDVDVEVART